MVIHQVLWVSMDGSLHKLICLFRLRLPLAAFRPLLIHHMPTHRLRAALVRTGTASALLKHIYRTGRQAHPLGFERHVKICALDSSMALPLQAKLLYLILPMASVPVPNHFERFKTPYKMKLQDLHRGMLASVGSLTVSISQRSSSSLRSSVHRPNPTRKSQDLPLHYPANSLCVREWSQKSGRVCSVDPRALQKCQQGSMTMLPLVDQLQSMKDLHKAQLTKGCKT